MKSITQNLKERVNTLYLTVKDGHPFTKEEVCQICGVGSERQAREIISTLATIKPIISTSDSKGYRMAVSQNDIEDARHCWAELSSRMEEIEKRILPLIKFCEKNS